MRSPFFESSDLGDLGEHLSKEGVRFERWKPKSEVDLKDKDGVLACYRQEIDNLKREFGYRYADVCEVGTRNESALLRDKFLSEHVHSEDEVRWFLAGSALIYIHANERIYIVECCEGDFISIPAGVKHWFDMGPKPSYLCIRWFSSEEGLINQFTGSFIAESTPRWEAIMK